MYGLGLKYEYCYVLPNISIFDISVVSRQRLGEHCLKSRINNEYAKVIARQRFCKRIPQHTDTQQ
jgi:hypothetical protein